MVEIFVIFCGLQLISYQPSNIPIFYLLENQRYIYNVVVTCLKKQRDCKGRWNFNEIYYIHIN